MDDRDPKELADGLLVEGAPTLDACIAFIVAGTREVRDGRARARMCRRMKHIAMTETQKQSVVSAILGRLTRGDFSQQFKDELRLARTLDAARTLAAARACANDEAPHVRRYARWTLDHIDE